jgi:hypothetical protein
VWKNKIVKLWVTRVNNSDYLKKLVMSMPRRVAEVIEKDSAIIGYWSHYEINCICTFVSYFYIFSYFSDRSVMFSWRMYHRAEKLVAMLALGSKASLKVYGRNARNAPSCDEKSKMFPASELLP